MPAAVPAATGALLMVGKVLSILILLLVLAAMINVWRRKSFPGITYGGVPLSRSRLQFAWTVIILGGLLLGVTGDFVVSVSTGMETSSEAFTPNRSWSLTVPLPFYRFEGEQAFEDQTLVEESTVEGVLIPWPLLIALLAYLVLVLRWNPEGPWVHRLLQGRGRETSSGTASRDAGPNL